MITPSSCCWPVICIYQNINLSAFLNVTLWTLKNVSACSIWNGWMSSCMNQTCWIHTTRCTTGCTTGCIVYIRGLMIMKVSPSASFLHQQTSADDERRSAPAWKPLESFSTGALPRTPLWELTTVPSRLRGGYPRPIPLTSTPMASQPPVFPWQSSFLLQLVRGLDKTLWSID